LHTDVGALGFVRPRWRKRLIKQIIRDRQRTARIGDGLEFPLLLATQAQLFSLARNTVTSGLKALRRHFLRQPLHQHWFYRIGTEFRCVCIQLRLGSPFD